MKKYLVTITFDSDLEGEDWGDDVFEAEDETSVLVEVERIKNTPGITSCILKEEIK